MSHDEDWEDEIGKLQNNLTTLTAILVNSLPPEGRDMLVAHLNVEALTVSETGVDPEEYYDALDEVFRRAQELRDDE